MKVDFIRIRPGDSVVILPYGKQGSFPTNAQIDRYSCDLPIGFEFAKDAIGDLKLYYRGNEVSADVQVDGEITRISLYAENDPIEIYDVTFEAGHRKINVVDEIYLADDSYSYPRMDMMSQARHINPQAAKEAEAKVQNLVDALGDDAEIWMPVEKLEEEYRKIMAEAYVKNFTADEIMVMAKMLSSESFGYAGEFGRSPLVIMCRYSRVTMDRDDILLAWDRIHPDDGLCKKFHGEGHVKNGQE